MKALALLFIAAASLLAGVANLHSQAPAPRTPRQALEAMKTQNQKLLEQQTATLQKLEELHKAAQQLRFMARRT